jgi:hypothetical protein
MPEDAAFDAADEARPIDRNMRLRLEVFAVGDAVFRRAPS